MTTTENEIITAVEKMILNILTEHDDIATGHIDLRVVSQARKDGFDVPDDGQWPVFHKALGRLERRGAIISTGNQFVGVGRKKARHWVIPAVHDAALAAQADKEAELDAIRARVTVFGTNPLLWNSSRVLVDGQQVAEFNTSDLYDAAEEAEKFARTIRSNLINANKREYV